jgi:sugar lactone lactonase YvrE
VLSVEAFAGNGDYGFSGDGGPATQASLRSPRGVAVGPDGSVYIADTNNNRVRRVGPDGIISTVAGAGAAGFAGDGGPAQSALLNGPAGVAVAADGSLFIADYGNDRVRRVAPDGEISTVAGAVPADAGPDESGDGGPALTARVEPRGGLGFGQDGSLYITDRARVRRVAPDGIITTVAGTGSFYGNGVEERATETALGEVNGFALGGDGTMYIGDCYMTVIRKVPADGSISRVTRGCGGLGVGPDGSLFFNVPFVDSPPPLARLSPDGVFSVAVERLGANGDLVFGPDNSLYVPDAGTVWRVRFEVGGD